MSETPVLLDTRGDRITDRRMRSGFRVSIISGSLAQLWFVTVSLPLIMFFEKLGASNQTINYIGALGLFAMLAQVPAAFIGERLKRRKGFWCLCAFSHRFLWLVPALIAWFLAPSEWAAPLTLAAIGVSNILAQMGTASWMSWMADLIPDHIRGRFWGRRQIVCTSVLLVALLATGWLLDYFKGEFWGFAVIFAFGAVMGCVDIILHTFGVPEPKVTPLEPGVGLWQRLAAPLRIRDFRWLTATMALWQFALGVVGGLGAVYLRRYYDASFTHLSWTSVAGALGSIISGFLGAYLIDRIGARVYGVVMMALLIVSVFSWFFLFDHNWVFRLPGLPEYEISQAIGLIILASIGAGMAVSGVALAQTSLLAEIAPREGRTMAMAVHWTLVGLVGALGPWIGGTYADWIESLGPTWSRPDEWFLLGTPVGFMHALTAMQISVILLAAMPALLMVRGRGHQLPMGEALQRLVFFNPVRFVGSVAAIYQLGSAPGRKERARAARRLASLRTHIAASDLIKHLDDPSPDVREAATFALSKLGGPDALEALIAKIDDPGSDLASHAIRALREIGDPTAVPPLIRKIADGDREIRTQAVRALGRIGDRRATGPLLSLLRDTDDPKTFVSAAEALAQLGGMEALPDLLDYLRGIPDSVRKRSVAIAAGDLAGGEPGRFYRGLAEEGQSRGLVVSRWLKICLRSAHAALLAEPMGKVGAPEGGTGTVEEVSGKESRFRKTLMLDTMRLRLEMPEKLVASFEEAYEMGRLSEAAALLPELAGTAVSGGDALSVKGGTTGKEPDVSDRRAVCRRYWERLANPPKGEVTPDEVEILLGLFLVVALAGPE